MLPDLGPTGLLTAGVPKLNFGLHSVLYHKILRLLFDYYRGFILRVKQFLVKKPVFERCFAYLGVAEKYHFAFFRDQIIVCQIIHTFLPHTIPVNIADYPGLRTADSRPIHELVKLLETGLFLAEQIAEYYQHGSKGSYYLLT